jgi:sugar-specific transcriptional regulator TrmB
MAGNEYTISQLRGVLTGDLDWPQYQAAAYCALVMNGELQVKDIELEADIPNSRVYGVLSKLEERGCVKQKGFRPKTYDAIHPRDVISDEVEQFRRKSEQAKSRLEEAWEAERSLFNDDDDTWALDSTRGLVNQVRTAITDAEEAIYAVDANLRWISREDRELMSDLVDDGVSAKIIGADDDKTVDRLADEGVTTFQSNSIERSFYVIDNSRVIARIGRGGSGVAFSDSAMATIFIRDFEDLASEATEVSPLAP